MMPAEPVVVEQSVAEPTLATVLTEAVRTAVPTRLYQLLHLAFPLAVDFAFRGSWRLAAAAMAVTAFGAWGLADRWLWNAAEDDPAGGGAMRLARAGRAAAGTVTATLTALLVVELFLRVLGSPPGH
jgi:hypothetical protein